MKVRLDRLLVERGLAPSRERAQALILAGRVLVDQQKVEKAGSATNQHAEIRLLGEDMRYVSRGGLKLEHALRHWSIDLAARTCMDVGASTGGFTDCMLRHGAGQVIAIDTGYGQMDIRIRNDPHVLLLEKSNARYLQSRDLEKLRPHIAVIGFLAIDVSFISVTLVLPAVLETIRQHNRDAGHETGCEAVVLIKPQFEVGRDLVGKGGIVRDPEAQQSAVDKVVSAVRLLDGDAIAVIESPILGSEGNKEFLLHANFTKSSRTIS